LLNETAQSRFAARALMGALQDFVAVTVSWLREQNQFDPVVSELDFGSKESPQTAWEINLANGKKLALTGRIDRVDLWRNPDGSALAVVLDYKSSHKKLDALFVEHGIQLQLLAYLNVLRHWKDPRPIFSADKLVPKGVFYVNLRGQFENGDSRDDVLGKISLKNSPNEPLNLAQTAWYSNDRPPSPAVPSPLPSDGRGEGQGEVRVSGFHGENDESRRLAYRHTGRFDASALDKLDTKHARDQFNYRLKNDGTLYAGLTEALAHEEFAKLLDRVEIQLREFGDAIYSGEAGVDPYRKGKQTPCEYCDYRPVCRIDPWTHRYRMLQ
jgi:ATP-dependent helicase/nuclease subunit B